MSKTWPDVAAFKGGRQGSWPRNTGAPKEAGKGKEMDSPQKGTEP